VNNPKLDQREKLDQHEAFKKVNLGKLLKVLGNININEAEMYSLEWLSGWSIETTNNICSVIEKAKNKH